MAISFRNKPVVRDESALDDLRFKVSTYASEYAKRDKEYREQERSRLARNKMAALAFVNQVRNELRLGSIDELVPGSQTSPNSCVLSNSVKKGAPLSLVSTGTRHGSYYRTRWGVRLYKARPNMPEDVSSFIVDFDCGKYPELLKR